MENLKDSLDYFYFGEINFPDQNLLKAKAIEALIYYKTISPFFRKFPGGEIQIDKNGAYFLLKSPLKGEEKQIPFLKLKKSRNKKEYEVWIATDTSLRYLLEYLLPQ